MRIRVGGGVECWGRREGPKRPVLDVPEEPLTVATASRQRAVGSWVRSTSPTVPLSAGEPTAMVEADPPEGRFVDVATGSGVSCGVRADQTIECWGITIRAGDPPGGKFTSVSLGSGNMGAGYGSMGLSNAGVTTVWGRTRAPGGQFSAVSAGPYHPCGLRTDGTVVCWGGNTTGRESAPGGRFTDVVVGWGRACGLRADGTLLCWRGSYPDC